MVCLAAVVHDLKNPLAVIQWQAQLLRRGTAGPEAAGASLIDGLDLIVATTRRMAAMLDELADLGQLRAGRQLELQREAVDLVALVRESAAEHQITTTRHRVGVEATAPEVVGQWDRLRLARELDNLLGNAIKYSPGGGKVAVTIRREEEPPGASAVLAVQDTGVGVPTADLHRVFESFRRGAKQIVERHAGMIAVESTEGSGSTVTVRLPLDSAPDAPDPVLWSEWSSGMRAAREVR